MFGLSWGQILLILLVGAFVLGPERIPTAVRWALGTAQKAKAAATGARQGLLGDLGPEIAELRRQIAELQSLAGVTGANSPGGVIKTLTAQLDHHVPLPTPSSSPPPRPVIAPAAAATDSRSQGSP